MSKEDISVEELNTGALRVYCLVEGILEQRVYIGYNRVHAINKFYKEFNNG